MKHRVFILLSMMLMTAPITGQILNIRTDIDNRAHNSALVSRVVLDVFGEEMVNTWLEHDTRFMLLAKTDSLSRVMDMKLLKSHKGLKMRNKDIKRVFSYIQSHDVRFPYAYADDTGVGYKKSIQLSREHYNKEGFFLMPKSISWRKLCLSSFIINNHARYKEAKDLLDKMGYTMIGEDKYVTNVNQEYEELGIEPSEKWNEFRDRKR